MIASFPCQTFSVMGRKADFDASRGQIIFHLARILKDAQPKCFILKNVKNVAQHFALNEMSLLCSRGQILSINRL